jgi:GAF domain-containing protein/HAMP domain-containing protein
MTEKQGRTPSSTHTSEEMDLGPDILAQDPGEQRGLSSDYRRMLAIQRVGLAVLVIAGLAFAAILMMFFQTQAWHLLGIASLIALGGGVFFVARNMAGKGQPDRASYLMFAAPLVLLPALAFFLTGLTVAIAVVILALTVTLASLVLPRSQLVWAVAAGLLSAGLIFSIEHMVPWPRFEMAQFGLSQVVTYGSFIILVLVILWQLISAYREAGTIRVRLLIAFVLVALLPVLIISLSAGAQGIQSDRDQAFNRLETVTILKEVEIKDFIRNSQITLANALNTEDQLGNVHSLIQNEPTSQLYREAHQRLQDHFEQLIDQNQRLEELFLMDSQGQVVVSTDPIQEGEILNDQVYFQEGLKGVYVAPPFYSSLQGQMPLVFTRPVIDSQGHIFVLAGRASMKGLNEIMRSRAGLGETVETFLVDRNYALVTFATFGEEGTAVRTQGAVTAIEGQENGLASYENFGGRPVLGVYHWLPELRVALLVEQDQSEAFHKTYTSLIIMGGVALGTLLAAVTVSLFVTRTIANPLANLAQTATQIAAGDLERTAKIERDDEVGALARAFNGMTSQLRELISGLEQRVAERTRDLKRRAVQLQAAAEVGRAAASIHDRDELLPQVTRLISDRFGFYHAGIFLLDEADEYAVLRAANSEGGRRMLDRGHRLRVGEQGIVGYVTGTREPRIALDVGDDAVHFRNPDLPLTRSEMALPLIVSGHVLGALDVQSTEEAAFTREDIEVLQMLADQVAVAIENARLLDETQKALELMRRAYGEMSRQAWEEMLRVRPELGFRCDERGVTGATGVWRPEMEEALREGQTVQLSNLQATDQPSNGGQPLAVPIKVRGQVVGVLDTYKPEDAGQWMPEEIAILELITEQLGAALESARLYQDTQRRAARERLTREITDELRRASSAESVVQTAVDELFRVLGTSRAFGKLEAAPSSQDREKTSEP